jgi:signal transduction histidine kinase
VGVVAHEVIELMAHELRKRGVELRNGLPEGREVRVRAESGPLHQVLLNLLVNSMHAIDSAGPTRIGWHFIRIAAEERDGDWIISVADSGCGISEANRKNLFKPFFTTKDIGKGTGLGLATSYRIVEGWGGTIEVSSREGEGAEFRLLLPKA